MLQCLFSWMCSCHLRPYMFLLLVGAVICMTITSLGLFHNLSLRSRNCWSCKHALSCAFHLQIVSEKGKLVLKCDCLDQIHVPSNSDISVRCAYHVMCTVFLKQFFLIKYGHLFRSVKCNPFLINQLPDGLSTGMNFRWDFFSDVQHDMVIAYSNIILIKLLYGN